MNNKRETKMREIFETVYPIWHNIESQRRKLKERVWRLITRVFSSWAIIRWSDTVLVNECSNRCSVSTDRNKSRKLRFIRLVEERKSEAFFVNCLLESTNVSNAFILFEFSSSSSEFCKIYTSILALYVIVLSFYLFARCLSFP